jgi:hypothetical protein
MIFLDTHSNNCLTVKSEVYDHEYNQNKSIDFKLSKLEENLRKIKNRPDFDSNKDSFYLLSILQYIQDSICNLILKLSQSRTIEYFEKDLNQHRSKIVFIIFNCFQTLIVKFKGSFATGVLLERAKYLVKEKLRIRIEEKKTSNKSFKSSFVEELEKKKQEKEQIFNKLNLEKEKLKNKVKCYQNQRHSVSRQRSPNSHQERKAVNKKPEDLKYFQDENFTSNENEGSDVDLDGGLYNLYNYKPPQNQSQILNEISSDLENLSLKSFQSDLSISTIRSSNKPIDFDSLQANLAGSKNSFFEMCKNKQTNQDISLEETKRLYKNFVKMFLKIKFEKLKNDHPGQRIPEKALFQECLRMDVPENKYDTFLEEELNNWHKYSHLIKVPKAKGSRLTRTKNHKPLMDIINEESF